MVLPDDLLRCWQWVLPVLQAGEALGGSVTRDEVIGEVIAKLGHPGEAVELEYPERPKSVLFDRIDWTRSYCKLSGAVDSSGEGGCV